MTFEKKYWSANEFTDSNGKDFVGYVGICDGTAYKIETNEKLVKKNLYLNRINLSDDNFDRVLSQKLVLPFEKKDVTFAANDFLYARTVKTIIERLQANNDYLYKNAIISNSILPAANECILFSSLTTDDGDFDTSKRGFLGKWDFSSSALSSKTQDDSYLYAQTENEIKYFAKTKLGKKVENIDENTNFISVEQYSESYSGPTDPKEVWKDLYGRDIETDIDYDSEEISAEEISTQFETAENEPTQIKEYFYTSFPAENVKFAEQDGPITCNLEKNGEIKVYSLGFIFEDKTAPEDIIVNTNFVFTKSKEYKAGDGFIYVIYTSSDKPLNSGAIIISGLEGCRIVCSSDNEVLFSCDYTIGTEDKLYSKCKTLPNAIRKAEYKFVWTPDSSATTPIEIEAYDANWTYQYLKETKAWRESPNPALVKMSDTFNDERYFEVSNSMRAADVYSIMRSNYNDCWYPKLKRTVSYTISGEINNINYKEKTYSVSTFKVEKDSDSSLKIVKSYKAPDEVYADLCSTYYEPDSDIPATERIYSSIPEIVQETYSITKEAELHDFNSITASEILIRDVDEGSCNIIVFLLFKTKLLLFKTKYYFDAATGENKNYISSVADKNNPDLQIDLNNAIVIDHINPHDDSSLKFLNLNAIKIHKNSLYLVDNKLDMILRYNIGWLTNSNENIEDVFNENSIILTDVLQGYGSSTDKIYFNNPYSIDVNDDFVYIVDRNNKCVKVYSTNFNFVKTLKNGYFSTHDIQSVAINPYPCKINEVSIGANSVWIVSALNNKIFISVLEDDIVKVYGQIEDISLLQDEYSWVEEVRTLKFSATHSNYFYLITSKRAYKFHVSRPFYPFASLSYFKQRSIVGTMRWSAMRYPWHSIPSIFGVDALGSDVATNNQVTWDYLPPSSSAEILDNKCFCLTSNEAIEGDVIFHFGILYDNSQVYSYIKDKKKNFDGEMYFSDISSGDLADMIKSSAMLLYVEPDSFISTLANNKLEIYDIYKIEDNLDDDYINALTINKILHSLVYNLAKIKNSLIGHYRAATNLDNVIIYDNVVLNDYFNNLQFDESENYFIHSNEVLSIMANRPFEKIYDLQVKILEKMQTEYMAAQSYINNTSRLI